MVYISSKTLFQLVIFSPLVQNTALHLAAIHDSPDVVSCLLSYPEQEILMNNKNHNVLDAALNSDRKNVSLAIASHERLVKENHSFNSSIQRSARGISRALHVINTHKLDLHMKIIVFAQSLFLVSLPQIEVVLLDGSNVTKYFKDWNNPLLFFVTYNKPLQSS